MFNHQYFALINMGGFSCCTLVELSEDAQVKFKEYVQFEEDRLRKNLTAIKYDIDALETVYGVIGPGRVEKVHI